MGHLGIAGAKMSKSLKNFTTIREELSPNNPKGSTARGLRIVFLLGGWRGDIEVTEEVTVTARSWEDTVDVSFQTKMFLTRIGKG
jgi:cysteinyl-tRNA synthetase